MPRADYFTQFGLYARRGFLPPELRAAAIHEMAAAPASPGAVWKMDRGPAVDRDTKRRSEFLCSALASGSIGQRFLEVIPELEAHFKVELSGFQELQFVRYVEGDFYRMHRDSSDLESAPVTLTERKVSVVVFLSEEGEEPEDADYCGGNLTFYDLVSGQGWNHIGHPLIGEAGMLIAFRPETPHEVRPVTWGTRHTITTWYR
jgi:SM-20-related protein